MIFKCGKNALSLQKILKKQKKIQLNDEYKL